MWRNEFPANENVTKSVFVKPDTLRNVFAANRDVTQSISVKPEMWRNVLCLSPPAPNIKTTKLFSQDSMAQRLREMNCEPKSETITFHARTRT